MPITGAHRGDKRQDRQRDILNDEENGLRLIFSRVGAELISLARVNEAGDWTGFLYRDNDLAAPYRGWAKPCLLSPIFFALAIISLAKCGTSIFPVGKCRFPKMNCQDP